jgi:NTE family protein
MGRSRGGLTTKIHALLASARLPFLFRAVEIGEPYWDGGHMGNPAFFPSSAAAPARTSSSCG